MCPGPIQDESLSGLGRDVAVVSQSAAKFGVAVDVARTRPIPREPQ